ncbi:hypothetical protein V1477_014165 [Vespula maculifrons]|uniref:Uncharacterized protein n=1 Tax=Vespula maculifrons TaxID=7453 RepID=A0ABD2BK97_VESMC
MTKNPRVHVTVYENIQKTGIHVATNASGRIPLIAAQRFHERRLPRAYSIKTPVLTPTLDIAVNIPLRCG